MALLAFIERVDTRFNATGCSWRPFFLKHNYVQQTYGGSYCRWKRGPNGSSTVKGYLALNFVAI